MNLNKVMPIISLCLVCNYGFANSHPQIASSWVQLRKSALFESETIELAPVWGPTIAAGTPFFVKESYGRWLYGAPEPLPRMKKQDQAPLGWVYNRTLLPNGDSPTRSQELLKKVTFAEAHSAAAGKKLNVSPTANSWLYPTFLNSLVLSQKTAKAFAEFDEPPVVAWQNILGPLLPWNWLSSADAADKSKNADLGFSGANLNFLRIESETAKNKRMEQKARIAALQLKPFTLPPITEFDREFFLARFLGTRKIDFPTLTHDEVDAHLYMRALTLRALNGCRDSVRAVWEKEFWNVFRFKNLSGRPDGDQLWVQWTFPAGHFLYSDQVLRVAENEAELAFILVRPFVLYTRSGGVKWEFTGEIDESTVKLSANALDRLKMQQATKLNANLDVADDIFADLAASECIAAAGYRFDAGLTYLGRMRSARESSWAVWFNSTTSGLDYRLQQLENNLAKGLREGSVKQSQIVNRKRFQAAAKLWNL